ncbi:DUF4102 domain-containing protein [Ancylobacter sonchi]|uniref:Arm DNA-binding domain-containing protein n=1 Tax=Ancylobacter sonchi TaxID=1937790 RepID=UPI001BD6CE2F|nr:DUF4102 domain-containing protein [Ancylobacter sonchi]
MPLSELACRNIKPGKTLKKLSDGGGLQLWLQPNGSKLWRLAYRTMIQANGANLLLNGGSQNT